MPAITEQFSDFASSTVAGGAGGAGTFLNAGDTSLVLSAGAGANFPAAGAAVGTWKLLLGDPNGAHELVLVSVRATDTLTIVRAQEGTSAQTWPFGTPVQAVVTAGSWQTLYTRITGTPINVRDYGATGGGVTDDTTFIQNALNAAGAAGGGTVFFPGGTYLVSVPLTTAGANTVLRGDAKEAVLVRATAGFSGAQVLLLQHIFCAAVDLSIIGGPTTLYSTNPATNGIQVTGVTDCRIEHVYFQYINGWAVQVNPSGANTCNNMQLMDCKAAACKQGYHFKSTTAAGYSGEHFLYDCFSTQTAAGDAFLIEDCSDVYGTNLVADVLTGTGSALHISGNSAVVGFVNSHFFGVAAAPCVLLDNTANGSPSFVNLTSCCIEIGTIGVSITQGSTYVVITGCQLSGLSVTTVNIANTADVILLSDCMFSFNGQSASGTKLDLLVNTSGRVKVRGCVFTTPQGTAAVHLNNVVTYTAGTVYFEDCEFLGPGFTSANIFTATLPTLVRNCIGYNPVGNFVAGLPASNVNYPVLSYDAVYCVSGGTVTVIKIGGVATGLITGAFRIPAGQTFSITYTVGPTVTGFGD